MATPAFNRNANPKQFRHAVGTALHIARRAPLEIIEKGVNWYPASHDAAMEAGRTYDFSTRQGAGIIAAASPAMEYETKNVAALSEIRSLTDEHWGMIQASASQPRVPNPSPDRPNATKSAKRIPEVRAMLREVVPNLAQANDRSLMKTHAILHGGVDPDQALNRRTAPKTNAFFHNILDPSGATEQGRDRVTIDGRMFDIYNNSMLGWKKDRGIGSADLVSGKPTKYEDAEEIAHGVHSLLQREDPEHYAGTPTSASQSVIWEAGKGVEMSFPTASGKPRKQGPQREGQPYVPTRKTLQGLA